MVALIIEDVRLNIEILETLLEQENIDAVSVCYPAQLEKTLAQIDNVEVVFLDLEFPNHNGFDLLRQLRQDTRFKEVPIIAYSVHTSEIDVVRRAGFDGFLGKPVNPQRFSTYLKRILNREAVWEI